MCAHQDFAILDYRVNMRLDSLPVAEMATFAYEDKPEETVELYNLGYPVGSKLEKSKEGTEEDKWVVNNHCRRLIFMSLCVYVCVCVCVYVCACMHVCVSVQPCHFFSRLVEAYILE